MRKEALGSPPEAPPPPSGCLVELQLVHSCPVVPAQVAICPGLRTHPTPHKRCPSAPSFCPHLSRTPPLLQPPPLGQSMTTRSRVPDAAEAQRQRPFLTPLAPARCPAQGQARDRCINGGNSTDVSKDTSNTTWEESHFIVIDRRVFLPCAALQVPELSPFPRGPRMSPLWMQSV